MKQVERRAGLPSGSVNACTTTWLAQAALVDQHFSPWIRQPPSARTAVTCGLAASEPRPGSERPKTIIRLPAARSARWAFFWSSLPKSMIGLMPRLAAAPGVIAALWLW